MLRTADFDFDLPIELIAQTPFFPKEETKMLVSDCNKNLLEEKQIIHLIDFLQEGDVLVFNDVLVIKAKLCAEILRNSSNLEFNLDQQEEFCGKSVWRALCKPAKKVKVGDTLKIATDFSAEVVHKNDEGFIKIQFNCNGNELLRMLDKYGAVPLPPYIKRDNSDTQDQKNYQTFFAKNGVAVAAPTAGLHFNEKIFSALKTKKIKTAFVTLNVGAGTFLPVRSEIVQDHKMHNESFFISPENCEIINCAKREGKKIVAVGTTSLRVLESVADLHGFVSPRKSSTEIFIFPPYEFKIVDVLMTNFHLPKSTLFMLVCAFVGRENAYKIYQYAIDNKFRFYSYGDCSLLFKRKL